MIRRILGRDRKLGISKKRSYDIPLDKGAGAGFLTLLIALMTFLAVVAVASSFMLKGMTDRWSSGLENKATVEIPAADDEGRNRSVEEISKIAKRIEDVLKNHSSVTSVEILKNEQIADLVSPWLGENFSLEGVPVPALISVEFDKDIKVEEQDEIAGRIRAIDKVSRLDTHEGWLRDLLRFAGALRLGAFALALIIAATTVTAVTGAVRSRMAVHGAEIELLHIIGASDQYISSQFQRHSMILALKGGLAGTIAGMLGLWTAGHIAGDMDIALLPDIGLYPWQTGILLTTPLIAGIVAMVTARITVLNALSQMP